MRTTQDVGIDNQRFNFDPANMILYGKANPPNTTELLGPYVQGV
jgi:L-ribulose-5-phosphate 3-epimerase